MTRAFDPNRAPDAESAAAERRAAEIAFARCFGGPDGERALAHLARVTVERTLGPDADAAALRDLEGQRRLYHAICGLIERGRTAPDVRV
ncbi:MAG: hypothetical protein RIB45_04375 [Marivibrio sp.]|uniref:Bbp19 family protein n=1 Tax=Marivibrio sp. TaxID=2039719 RepID=UPI0032EBA38E